MQTGINEAELEGWAVNRVRECMGDKINTLMRGWGWSSYMRDTVDKVVGGKATDVAIENFINTVDEDNVIKTVSDRIATEIADSLKN